MSESSGGAGLEEEPQEERGAPGSRDEGGGVGGHPDRPVGTSDADDQTSIDPQEPQGGPHLPTGDGG